MHPPDLEQPRRRLARTEAELRLIDAVRDPCAKPSPIEAPISMRFEANRLASMA